MTKSKKLAERKMRERAATAGSFLKEAMEEAESPVDVILADIDAKEKALQLGLANAIKRGKYRGGLKKASERKSWEGSSDRAASHYAERADDMTEHAMEDYDQRMSVIETAKKSIAKMDKSTPEARIARSQAYLKAVHIGFDKLYGRN